MPVDENHFGFFTLDHSQVKNCYSYLSADRLLNLSVSIIKCVLHI